MPVPLHLLDIRIWVGSHLQQFDIEYEHSVRGNLAGPTFPIRKVWTGPESAATTYSHPLNPIAQPRDGSPSEEINFQFEALLKHISPTQAEAEQFCREYFVWYNESHHHVGLALLTPAQVHYGDPVALLAARHQTLLLAYERCPIRFGYRVPRLEVLPLEVYINPSVKPSPETAA